MWGTASGFADMQSTATLGRYRASVSDTCRPSIPGIDRSVSTRSKACSRLWMSSNADFPSGATSTWKHSAYSVRRTSARSTGSLSTTSTEAPCQMGPWGTEGETITRLQVIITWLCFGAWSGHRFHLSGSTIAREYRVR
jgi:hypothetical protein